MKKNTTKVSTGLDGLDEILTGGLLPQKAYLLRGGPGTGKSTIGYKFLEYSSENEEKGLLITLSESSDSAIENAASIGIDLENTAILDLSPEEQIYKEAQNYDVFPASEVESKPLIETIVNKIEELNPDRVVLDSVSMLRYMHQDPYQYRNIVLSFIRYICNKGATVLMISETHSKEQDSQVSFWVDGIINLRYKPGWRQINVTKFRGSDFIPGDHSFKLTKEGPQVFPQIQPHNYNQKFQKRLLSVGIKEMDNLLKGGIEKGTISLISGPTGVGKTSLGTQIVKQAALRDERSVIYSFEESSDVILNRTKSIGINLEKPMAEGNLQIKSIEPLTYSPDEFSAMVRQDVEQNDTEVVMIDSMGGFRLSFADEDHLSRLHSLGVYLQNMGVTTIFINEVQNVADDFQSTNMNASYLADNIIFLRYVEDKGTLRKIIGILKKRLGDFEQTMREYKITSNGLVIGEPVSEYQGLLTDQRS